MKQNIVGERIRVLRETKGFSQENLASTLGITQSSYARLEKDDSRINVPRLQQIAEYFDMTVGELLHEKAQKVINQSNNSYANAFVDSSPTYNADREHIQSLKEEIEFLKKLLEKKIV